MNRRRALAALTGAVVFAPSCRRTTDAPAGQVPLTTIGANLGSLQTAFNEAHDQTRLVVLLSPT